MKDFRVLFRKNEWVLVHYENDVYRDANYAKQKQNKCRLVYKLHQDQDEGNTALGSGWRLAVGNMSACSL